MRTLAGCSMARLRRNARTKMSIHSFMRSMKKPMEIHSRGNESVSSDHSFGGENSRVPLLRGIAAIIWRIARPVLIAYLVVVLAMMVLERWLVYPAPPLEAGDWTAAKLPHEDVWFTSGDGTKLHGWFFPNT